MTWWFSLLLALHLLAATLWVGSLAFALLALRPSLSALAPPMRPALLRPVMRRFFLLVWHAMPIQLITGYAMLFGALGGFAGANWAVHVMNLFGLVMAVVFAWSALVPWRRLRDGIGDEPVAMAQIRRAGVTTLVLGTITIAIAAFAT